MRKLAFVVLGGLLLTACSGVKVVTDLDKTIDFTEYKSLEYWGWADDSDEILNRFDKERLETAFANEFKKRGIDIVEKGEGDMIVSLYIVAEQKVQRSATTTSMGGYGGRYGYGPGYGWGGGHSTTTMHEYEYTEGTLLVSVFDAEKNELIWESAGTGTINEKPEKREAGIPKAVALIMKEYPVPPVAQ
ncbi:MAG TPA: DUF4136 domain-containing protein [Bacteroides sp.]|nr:DUF4136 domain-containing protein [Bacteroides sp.]